MALVDPDALEIEIDEGRMNRQWSIVFKALDQYAQLFDQRAVSTTNQHPALKNVRAYYWTCMSEYFFEAKKDFVNSVDCLRRCISIDPDFVDTKILMSRMLLRMMKKLLLIHYDPLNNVEIDQADNMSVAEVPLSLDDILGESAEVLTPSELDHFKAVLDAHGEKHKTMLLAVLGSLSTDDTLLIFNNFMESLGSDTFQTIEAQFVLLILITCKSLLSAVSLERKLEEFAHKQISGYRLWMWIDAVSTRCVLNELLSADFVCRADAEHIVVNMVPEDIDQQFLELLPPVCRKQILLAVSRLPLIDNNLHNHEVALNSFDRCVSMESPLRALLPTSLLVGLTVEAAILHLNRAHIDFIAESHSNLGTTAESSSVNEIEHAYSLLRTARHLLTTTFDTSAQALLHTRQFLTDFDYFNCAPLSQLLSLPEVISEPRKVVENSTSSIMAMLMAGILSFKCYKLNEKFREKDLVELFEWGLTYEIKPDPDLLWHLGCSYIKSGQYDDAINVLKQCSTTTMISNNNNSNRNKLSRSSLKFSVRKPSAHQLHHNNTSSNSYKAIAPILQWLGLDYQVSEHSWLATVKTVEILLQHRPSQLLDAFSILRSSIVDLYHSTGKTILAAVGSDKKTGVELNKLLKNRFLTQPEYGLGERYVTEANDLQYNQHSVTNTTLLLIDEGLYKLLALLARCHVQWSTQANVYDFDRMLHYRCCVRIVTLLADSDRVTDHNSQRFIYPTEDLAFYHALALAELRHTAAAIDLLKSQISVATNAEADSCTNNTTNMSSSYRLARLLHLLVLLTTVANDSPQKASTCTALIRQAIALAYSNNNTSASVKNSTKSTKTKDSLVNIWNLRATLASLEWHATAEKQPVVPELNKLLSEIAEEFENANTYHSNTSVHSSTSASCKHTLYSHATSLITDFKRPATTVLITIARVFRSAGLYSRAKSALEEAWRILYMIDKPVEDALRDIATGDSDEHQTINTFRLVPTLLGWRLPEGCGWHASHMHRDVEADVLAECALLVQVEEDNLCSPRAVELFQLALSTYPEHHRSFIALSEVECKKFETMSNLSSIVAIGKAAAHKLNESASNSNSNTGGGEVSSVYEHLGLQCAWTGVAAGDTSLTPLALKDVDPTLRASIDHKRRDAVSNSQALASAYHHSCTALLTRELSPDAWYAFGHTLELMGDNEHATEALLTSIECQQRVPLRPFTTALW